VEVISENRWARNVRVGIVVSEFNRQITDALLYGAIDAYRFHEGQRENLTTLKVPGAFEIPGTVNQLLKKKAVDAVLALGAVVRGGTPHFNYVSAEVSRGIAELSRTSDIPVIFGVLTTDTLEQARERAGTKAANKGWEVMEAALKTLRIYRQIGAV